jgi:hypothetical protein
MNTIRLNPIDPTPYRTFVTEGEKELRLETTLLIIAGIVVVGVCIYAYSQQQAKEKHRVQIIRRE